MTSPCEEVDIHEGAARLEAGALLVDTLRRSAAGKADYRYLRDVAARLAGS